MGDRYINPYTDFGFKKLFGSELNKELLISFLNALLETACAPEGNAPQEIVDISYRPTEQLGARPESRRTIFDVFCTTQGGEQFIVEMQNVFQRFYKDRSVYYASFPIVEQGRRGDWNFNLHPVYTVGILNFVLPDDDYDDDNYCHNVMLTDTEDNHVFFDKLRFIYLEMPKFKKTEDELVTMFDKWMFVLRNLPRLMQRPAALQERVFTRLFEQAEIARFTPEQQFLYEDSINAYRDITNSIDTAKIEAKAEGRAEGMAQGRAEGKAEEKQEIARKLKAMGLPVSQIVEATGLTAQQIDALDTN